MTNIRPRSIFTLTFFIVLYNISGYPGDKTDLKWQSFDAGVSKAKKINKKVLIDVYTDWCGWCKKMDKEVYLDDKIATYIAKNYVTVKLNAESNSTTTYKGESRSETELAKAFGVTGYPTTIFMEANGDLITSVSGYYDANKFMNIVKFVGGGHYKKMKFNEFLQKEESNKSK